jgi:hypothetical protein
MFIIQAGIEGQRTEKRSTTCVKWLQRWTGPRQRPGCGEAWIPSGARAAERKKRPLGGAFFQHHVPSMKGEGARVRTHLQLLLKWIHLIAQSPLDPGTGVIGQGERMSRL